MRVRREARAFNDPTCDDAIRLRWLWSVCVRVCERDSLPLPDNRRGCCDGLGCGRSHTIAIVPTDAIEWYQDETDECLHW